MVPIVECHSPELFNYVLLNNYKLLLLSVKSKTLPQTAFKFMYGMGEKPLKVLKVSVIPSGHSTDPLELTSMSLALQFLIKLFLYTR